MCVVLHMLTLIYHSAKELEHYQRVRQTFEGPPKDQDPKGPATAPSRIPAPKSHTSPALTNRPKLKTRTSTAKPEAKGKGKGKATQWDSDDDDDDDAYVTSNDSATPERRQSGINGNGNGGFGDVGGDDDEEIYG